MYPKQLLPLAGEKTMLQATALRLDGLPNRSGSTLVVCNESHRFSVAEQLAGIRQNSRLILEPAGRNTAPAIALAAIYAVEELDDPVMLVMAADHVILDVPAFQAAVTLGSEAASQGQLVTFGIVPTHPETGFGYIKAAESNETVMPVESFVEKPDRDTAQTYVDAGNYFWNSGMFLMQASRYLESLEKYAPEIYAKSVASMQSRTLDGAFIRPEPELFQASPSDSVDYAVMEKSASVSVVPLDCGWSDVGSWSALHEVLESDERENSIDGDVITHDCSNSLVLSESRLVGAVGLDNVVVVETKDSVLVANKNRCQDVKELVTQLKLKDRPEANLHRQVFRPWGSYDSLENADNFQVKQLVVKPGAKLSLQKHAHRSEHWVVVKGKARITRNNEEFDLGVNESTYIAIGDIHRIANPFDEPVHIIEVQCGDYLGEDDIERIEDDFGREGTNH